MTVNSVRLGPEIERRLGELAIRQQRSKSELIRQALGEYFERQAGVGQAPHPGPSAPEGQACLAGAAEAAGRVGPAEAGRLASALPLRPMRVVSSAA